MPDLRCLELAVGGIRVVWPGDFDGGGAGAGQMMLAGNHS